jgi:hypothetical protein
MSVNVPGFADVLEWMTARGIYVVLVATKKIIRKAVVIPKKAVPTNTDIHKEHRLLDFWRIWGQGKTCPYFSLLYGDKFLCFAF